MKNFDFYELAGILTPCVVVLFAVHLVTNKCARKCSSGKMTRLQWMDVYVTDHA